MHICLKGGEEAGFTKPAVDNFATLSTGGGVVSRVSLILRALRENGEIGGQFLQ